MSSPSSTAPRAVLLLKLDTLGDLILFAPTLRALRDAWPSTRLVTLIRRSYLDLAPLLAPGVEWLSTSADPFSDGPETDPAETHRLRAAVADLRPDIAAAATSRRNWLETALAAAAPDARRLALGPADADDEFFATRLRLALGVEASHVFSERLPLPPAEPDWLANLRLADTLLGHSVPRTPPALSLDAATLALATPTLASLNLAPGRYIACAPAGFANVRLKTWPAERFAAALRHLHERHGLRALLVGHEHERPHLETVRAATSLPPDAAPAIWTGREGSLPHLAALLAHARLYLGNDTGAMHLAAALDLPVVALFGGGTWPRFTPAARRGSALVHPLPCFGCGWDCPLPEAPCLQALSVSDATAALDRALGDSPSFAVSPIDRLPPDTRSLLDQAARRHRETSAAQLARQRKLEELTALAHEKDREIASLKTVCDEREKTIFILDGHVRHFQAENNTLRADKTVLEKTLAALPPDSSQAARALADQLVHIRNLEALLKHRDDELAALRTSAANRAAGLHDLENSKHYARLLAERDTALHSLRDALDARERLLTELAADATHSTADILRLWRASSLWLREKLWRPLDDWLFRQVVEKHWMQIGVLRHYAPRPLRWDPHLSGRARLPDSALPRVAIATPSYNQDRFLERTLLSVLDQNYPDLLYAVHDGASRDRSPEILARHAHRLRHWESAKDSGQADAIRRAFAHLEPELRPHDLMAWLNSDDLLSPGSLRFVAEYFATHPEVDVLYGHRIIIDDDDRDVGRWIMPPHDPATLEWIDYVPQETLFWRKRAWDLVGGLDPSFQFALDWDLLARFQQAGCRMVRVPCFLGAFRVHAEQKTSTAIHTTGAEEMRRIRARFHGERQDDHATIALHARRARFRGALTSRLHTLGLRW